MAANKNTNSKNRPSNYVILTLRVIGEAECRYTNSGAVMSKVRAFLSQGKGKDSDEYKPSIFFDVMAVSKDENHTALTAAIAELKNKALFTVKGRLAMDEWMGKDDVKRQQLLIFAASVEPFSFENGGNNTGDEGEELAEPA